MRETIEDTYSIRGFFGKYRSFSNYDLSSFEINKIIFKSGEHMFHYYKTDDNEWKQKILNAETPSIAKKLGRICPMKGDWDSTKVNIIQNGLFYKFVQNEHLKNLLLSTEHKYLEETNDWHDNFYGNCVCPKCINKNGENNLGKILMFIRAKLMTENYSY